MLIFVKIIIYNLYYNYYMKGKVVDFYLEKNIEISLLEM